MEFHAARPQKASRSGASPTTVGAAIRLRHCAYFAEQTYVQWIKRHPEELGRACHHQPTLWRMRGASRLAAGGLVKADCT